MRQRGKVRNVYGRFLVLRFGVNDNPLYYTLVLVVRMVTKTSTVKILIQMHSTFDFLKIIAFYPVVKLL